MALNTENFKKRKQIISVDLKSHFYSFDIKPSASFQASLQEIIKKYKIFQGRGGEWLVLNSLPRNPLTALGVFILTLYEAQ